MRLVRARVRLVPCLLATLLSCRGGAPPPAAPPLELTAADGGPSALQQRLAALTPVRPEPGTPASRRLDAQLDAFHRAHPARRAYLAVDKPLYRPGETIWLRTFELTSAALTGDPTAHGTTIQLVSPRGSVVIEKQVLTDAGAAINDLELPADLAGGEYLLRATSDQGATVERAVIVSAYQPPRIKKKLELLRKAYGPGDPVTAALALDRATGEALARHAAVGLVTVDGAEVARVPVTTDAAGKAIVRFTLPAQIGKGDGLLTILVDDGGLTESIQKRIPITLRDLSFAMYPEGGELVRGLPGRVYFHAKTPLDKPADVEGEVVDDTGQTVARFRSLHDGMGRFELVPQPGRTYQVKITRPVGIAGTHAVPAARSHGCTMQAVDDPTSQRDEVRVAVWCTRAQPVIATAVLRDSRLGSFAAAVPAGIPTVLGLPAPATAQGAVRVTLFDDDLAPLAERLIYRNRAVDLKITMKPDRASYIPRAPVTLAIETADHDGKPVAADLALAVVDDTVLSFADDKTGHLLSRLYLEAEMPGQKVEEPNFYFGDEPEAPAALDLVLGTQGWRRFDWKPVLSKPPAPPIDDPWDFTGVIDRDPRPRRARAVPRGAADDEAERAKNAEDEDDAEPKEEEVAEAQPARRVEHALEKPAAAPPPPPVKAAPAPEPAQVVVDARAPMIDPGPAPMAPPPMDVERAMGAMAQDEADWGGEEVMVIGRAAGQAADGIQLGLDGDRHRVRIREGRDRDADLVWQEPIAWAPVREFPAPSYDVSYDGPRVDFRDTIHWAPRVKTGADGKGTVSFHLSDAVTSFRVTAEGVGAGGLPGRGDLVVQSKLPVSLAVKMPLEVSAGDLVRLPVTIANETDVAQRADLIATFGPAFKLGGTLPPSTLDLAPRERRSFFYELTVVGDGGDGAGLAKVALATANLHDEVERTIRVVPLGFPQELSLAGTLSGRARHELFVGDLMGDAIDGAITLYPSPIATMTKGSEALIAEPGGCFEQASSTNYPNVMLMAYLEENDAADPALVERTSGVLDRGYKLLAGYESPQKGYEWFGGDPGHEALTAYGLMEFVDMAEVYGDVDRSMIERTSQWLKGRRDGKGGYQRNARALDSFGAADQAVTDAYITYALTEAKAGDLDAEVAHQALIAQDAKDPYVLALAANTLQNRRAKSAEAKAAVTRLLGLQAADGSFPGADHSITRSGGQALTIETTALAMLAMMKAGTTQPEVRKAAAWIEAQRDGSGGFGSTQSTVLALKAMTVYAKDARRTQASGVVTVTVDGKPAGRFAYEQGHQGAIELPLARFLHPGKNVIELALESTEALPYSGVVRFRSKVPMSSTHTKVALSTRLARAEVPMGESVRMDVRIENVTDRGIPMVLARVGLPGGLTFQTWQLKELRDKKLIDFYETREREVILYLRSMAPRAAAQIPLELIASVPGTYTAPASSAYLYYTDEHKAWIAPEKVTVRQKGP